MSKTRWGIVGTGYISNRFTDGLKYVADAEIAAVASRDISRAKEFAGRFGIPKTYGSYAEMAKDKDLDIIYIGTPNSEHLPNSLLFMDAGFNVLCEKPLGVNAKQVEAMVKKAKEKNVFFMEGMWTRFFPAIKQGLKWVKDGSIGEPRTLFANFGIDSSGDMKQWRFQRSMAGGSLMDVGIYPLAMAFAAFGPDPAEVSSFGHLVNGIDDYNTFTFRYADGKLAVLGSGLGVKMENKVVISGTKGCVKIGEGYDWWRANRAELALTGDDPFTCNGEHTVFEQPYPSFGFQYEAQAVQGYVKKGLKEAPEMPWSESLKIAKTIDGLRKAWNIVYDED
jgi:dihydrodiol dehydrogenase / D-xylose 1-dehydrogenase (NADP)